MERTIAVEGVARCARKAFAQAEQARQEKAAAAAAEEATQPPPPPANEVEPIDEAEIDDALPPELLGACFDALHFQDLRRAACVSRRWLKMARESAQRRVAQKTDAAACIYDRCGQPKMPSWLSMLGSITWLEERVGQRRHDRDWRDEFLLLKMGPVENKLVGFAWPLELRELGWPPEHAEALAVLATWVDKLFNFRIHEFAASAWMVREALVHAAKRQPIHMSNAHPHLYAMLGRDGAPPFLKPDRGSDSRSDSQQQFPEVDVCCWNKLTRLVKGRYALSKLTSDQRATNFLRTDAITLATDGSTNAGLVWRGQPGHQVRHVVRFIPKAADEKGLHALVYVGSGLYALPPLSCVRLESTDAPFTWKLPWSDEVSHGTLYTVSVSWV